MCATCQQHHNNPKQAPPFWKCETLGIWTYTRLPEKVRPATLADLLDDDNKPRLGEFFLAQSCVSGFWEAYRVNNNFPANQLRTLIDKKQAYVRN